MVVKKKRQRTIKTVKAVKAVKKKMQPMSTLFDFLPLDVINYVIKPFIENDYFSRVALNGVLPPRDKRATLRREDAAKQLALCLNTVKLKKLVNNATWAEGPQAKAEAISVLFEYLIHNPLILQHNMNFRETAFRQATTFADINCVQYSTLEEKQKVCLVLQASLLLEVMGRTPYLYPLNPSLGNEKWSAVDGAGDCIVVDNSRWLAIAAAKAKAKAAEDEKVRRSKPHWRVVYRNRRYCRKNSYDSYDYDYDEEEESEYGYYDKDNKWVLLADEEQWQKEQPRMTRQGTVLEADGWERVVSRRR